MISYCQPPAIKIHPRGKERGEGVDGGEGREGRRGGGEGREGGRKGVRD